MDANEFYDQHGEFPRWVLGWRDAKGKLRCLDHPRTKTPVFVGNNVAELAECCICGNALRHADNFLSLTEASLVT